MLLTRVACSAVLLGATMLIFAPMPASAHRFAFFRIPLYPPVVVVRPLPPVVVRPAPVSPVVVYTVPPVYVPVRPAATGFLQITVLPLTADIYLDGRYLGRAQDFRNGRLDLPVSPGKHLIEVRLGSDSRTHRIHVRPGTTVVIDEQLS